MLAEPRRKQRLSADPQNVAWERDGAKFGLKMLQKMGWTEGKGLGAREDGVASHVKVTIKRDASGVGATRNASDNWLQNTQAFDDLLANLNQSFTSSNDGGRTVPAAEPAVAAATTKTQTKRNGLYSKFLKGKDLRRYNEKDMAEIFATSRKATLGTPDTSANADENSESDAEGRAFVGFSHLSANKKQGGGVANEEEAEEEAEEVDQFGLRTRTSRQDLYSYFQQRSLASAAPEPPSPKPTKKRKHAPNDNADDNEQLDEQQAEPEPKAKKTKKAKKAMKRRASDVA